MMQNNAPKFKFKLTCNVPDLLKLLKEYEEATKILGDAFNTALAGALLSHRAVSSDEYEKRIQEIYTVFGYHNRLTEENFINNLNTLKKLNKGKGGSLYAKDLRPHNAKSSISDRNS